jgi:hypothetical protein
MSSLKSDQDFRQAAKQLGVSSLLTLISDRRTR